MVDNLADRVTELERRVLELEARGSVALSGMRKEAAGGEFWALDGVNQVFDVPGGVVFAGTVELSDGQHYEWQEQHATSELVNRSDEWLEVAAEALAALGHRVRLTLLSEVLSGRTEVSELVKLEQFGTSGQVYHHAKALIAAGWLRQAQRGHYLIPPERIVPLLVALAIGGGER